MNEEGGRRDPVDFYGPWTWIIGLAFGFGLIAAMFLLADSFS